MPFNHWQSRVFFADERDGWILNAGLWSTHDGGRTWHQVTVRGTVLGLAPDGPNHPMLLLTSGKHGPVLLRSAPGRDHWVPTGATLPAVGGNAHLTRDSEHVYVVRFDETGDGSSLEVSADGGASFRPRPDPCGGLSFSESLTRGPDGSLWFLCGSEGSAGGQFKKAYVSTNDGRSWAALPKLTVGGYTNFMTFGSASLGLLMMNRSPLWLTTDRGAHWRAVVQRHDEGFFTAGGWFGSMAYALTTRAVWVTNDGGHHWWEHRFGPS
jgi:photosystem II stability/assembly factor-like uncharacterized protein